jgi:hypothetical protein
MSPCPGACCMTNERPARLLAWSGRRALEVLRGRGSGDRRRSPVCRKANSGILQPGLDPEPCDVVDRVAATDAARTVSPGTCGHRPRKGARSSRATPEFISRQGAECPLSKTRTAILETPPHTTLHLLERWPVGSASVATDTQ